MSLVLGVVKDVSSTSSFCGPGSHGGGGSAPANITMTQHAVQFHNLSTLLLEVGTLLHEVSGNSANSTGSLPPPSPPPSSAPPP